MVSYCNVCDAVPENPGGALVLRTAEKKMIYRLNLCEEHTEKLFEWLKAGGIYSILRNGDNK